MADVKYDLVKRIKVLSKGEKTTKELNIVKWGDMEPTYDLRKWVDGKPSKGITFSVDETKELLKALKSELD